MQYLHAVSFFRKLYAADVDNSDVVFIGTSTYTMLLFERVLIVDSNRTGTGTGDTSPISQQIKNAYTSPGTAQGAVTAPSTTQTAPGSIGTIGGSYTFPSSAPFNNTGQSKTRSAPNTAGQSKPAQPGPAPSTAPAQGVMGILPGAVQNAPMQGTAIQGVMGTLPGAVQSATTQGTAIQGVMGTLSGPAQTSSKEPPKPGRSRK